METAEKVSPFAQFLASYNPDDIKWKNRREDLIEGAEQPKLLSRLFDEASERIHNNILSMMEEYTLAKGFSMGQKAKKAKLKPRICWPRYGYGGWHNRWPTTHFEYQAHIYSAGGKCMGLYLYWEDEEGPPNDRFGMQHTSKYESANILRMRIDPRNSCWHYASKDTIERLFRYIDIIMQDTYGATKIKEE